MSCGLFQKQIVFRGSSSEEKTQCGMCVCDAWAEEAATSGFAAKV